MTKDKRYDSNGRLLVLLKNLSLVILACLSISLCSFSSGLAKEKNADFLITIIHTNDIHAHDEPYLYKGKMVGGLSRLGNTIRVLREDARKKSKNVIVADAGDVFQGSTLYSHYLGEVEVNLLNMIGYDIFTLGNHEFDDGASNVAKQFKIARFDIINSNLDLSPVKALNKIVKPYVIREFDGKKIAFVGAITPQIELLSGGLEGAKLKAKGNRWTEPIAKVVAKLKEEGINKIVLVTHCGLEEDKELAEKIPDVDAIIGGHSHTTLNNAVVIEHTDGRSTTIVQTGCYSQNVGKLELAFDNKGLVVTKNTNYKLYPVNDKLTEAKDIKEYVALKVKPLLHLRNEIVGYALEDFGSKARQSDSSIGNLVCDALYEAGKDYGVEISMHNRGGLRGHLEKGPISIETVEQILPFDNYAVFSTVKGSEIIGALEHSFSGMFGMGGKFMDVRGLKVAYDPSKPSGKRVVFALTKGKNGKWSNLEPERWYKFAINSYNFQGGEGYNFKSAKNVVDTKVRISNILQKYLLGHSKISPQKPNRMVAIKSGLLKKNTPEKVILSGVAPGARLCVVAGTAPGVSTIYNTFPVPLSDASIIETSLKADAEGKLLWPGNKQALGKAKNKVNGNSAKSKSDLWLCVVAHPPKKKTGNANERTMISNPISLSIQ